ncbi:hypothetical protein [Mesorhizobium erdmanii]|uniref:hypothetical protein n=1 Tax=Mesorhizobium erdmanii TaxID=1777866 RepID=UPI0012B672D2|nr:hypothetical protein [Mesorhizobium erdmanii]
MRRVRTEVHPWNIREHSAIVEVLVGQLRRLELKKPYAEWQQCRADSVSNAKHGEHHPLASCTKAATAARNQITRWKTWPGRRRHAPKL